MTAITPIQTVVVGSGGAASITFSAIPADYTDLLVVLSGRQSSNGGNPYSPITISFNGSGANKSSRYLIGESGGIITPSYTEFYGWTPSSLTTANTFSNIQIKIPNYRSSANKSASIDSVSENNATANLIGIGAWLWSDSAAITSVQLTALHGNFVEFSSATLYGVLAGSDGIVAVS